MDNPYLKAASKAFRQIIQDCLHSSAAGCREWARTGKLAKLFDEQLEYERKAADAEETSRQVAVAELRAAIDEGFETLTDYHGDSVQFDESIEAFRTLVEPWLDRLES